MSKKLIAVASAAALALSLLVAAPASATPVLAYLGEKSGTTGTSADPYIIAMASSNTIATGASADPATATALRILVTSIAAGDTVKVTTTGALKVSEDIVTAANSLIDVRKVGTSTYSKTLTSGTSLELHVFTTSTTAGTFVVDVTKTASGTTSTTSATKHLKAAIGLAYKTVNVTAPATIANGATGEVTFNVTDVFGNVRESNAGVQAVTVGTTTFAATWDANRKLNFATITSPSSGPFTISVDGGGSDVAGFESHTSPVVVVANSPAVASQNAALTAQVAALTAQLANSRGKDLSVTKKRYNNLAKRWNRAFPGQAVKLK